jgi:hypothetical protein
VLTMQAISRTEFLELLGLSSGAFDQLQHAGHVALAFGTPLPATPGRYLDLVAMAINLGLTPWLGREVSTVIVSGFFHQWASGIGHAEADPSQNFFMAVWRGRHERGERERQTSTRHTRNIESNRR